MGMDLHIDFPPTASLAWSALRHALPDLTLRMIDGELAFPDEEPTDGWRELRLGTSAGMVTLRRNERGATCVIWGNADASLQSAWRRVADAVAQITSGTVR
jgi:hypothetical protein